jgi:hypothetical protein
MFWCGGTTEWQLYFEIVIFSQTGEIAVGFPRNCSLSVSYPGVSKSQHLKLLLPYITIYIYFKQIECFVILKSERCCKLSDFNIRGLKFCAGTKLKSYLSL